jgi:hypothetical protein
MLSFIIIALIVIALVTFIKGLHPEDRGIVFTTGRNIVAATGTYTLVAVKGSVRTAYNIGANAAAQVEANGQDSLDVMHDYNTDMDSKGGVIKATVRVVRGHSDILGIGEMNSNLSESTRKLVAANKLARANRTPRV